MLNASNDIPRPGRSLFGATKRPVPGMLNWWGVEILSGDFVLSDKLRLEGSSEVHDTIFNSRFYISKRPLHVGPAPAVDSGKTFRPPREGPMQYGCLHHPCGLNPYDCGLPTA